MNITMPMGEPHHVTDDRMRTKSTDRGWIAAELRDQGMPPAEIDALLSARDLVVVHRYVELHAERLEERLTEQRRSLMFIEQLLGSRIIGQR